MLARLGGDEFAIIAPGLSLPTTAGRITETILETQTFRASAPRFFELRSGGKPAASSEVAR
jgi:GGDEF domain-containing protein